MWLEDVHIPWERVFLAEPVPPERIARWLFWHQLYCWLSKAEFTLGLALACAHAIGLTSHDPTINYLLDLMTDVQTVRSCQTAAERDPQFTSGGLLLSQSLPSRRRQHRDAEGAPVHERDAAHRSRLVPGGGAGRRRSRRRPKSRAGLEESFSGGGYTALQRSALLQMAWDHVSSALDGARIRVRVACQWRHPRLARPVAARLRGLQRTRQCACCANSAWRCRRSTSATSATLPMAPRRVVEAPPTNR